MTDKEKEAFARTLPPRLLVAVPDAALALGVSAATVREMIASGALRAVNLASDECLRPRYYVYRSSLFALLERRETGF